MVLVGNDAELKRGLQELRQKLAGDHRLSGFFNQPMKGYPSYQNRIWKWDFAPEGDTSSTRKGWRLFAYVENPNSAEPIVATPFLVYAKPGPKGNPPTHISAALKKFLTMQIQDEEQEERYRHQTDSDGKTRSICLACWCTVIVSDSADEVIAAEGSHACRPR